MFATLLIAATMTAQDLPIPRTPENIAFETRFKGQMRAKMTPAERKAAEKKYAEYRERLEPGRKLFHEIIKGEKVCPPELREKKRADIRAMLANLEATGRWWDAPASYRRWVESTVQLGEKAIKKLED